jgi:hypothetical protein
LLSLLLPPPAVTFAVVVAIAVAVTVAAAVMTAAVAVAPSSLLPLSLSQLQRAYPSVLRGITSQSW